MKTKLLFIPLLPMAILFLMFYEKTDDISNMPSSLIAEFTRFTEPSQRDLKPYPLPRNDYHKLMDIDFEFKTLPLVCKNQHPFLLILVHSAPGNFEKRKVIRETWGRASGKTRLVFLLGSVNTTDDDEIIGNIKKEYKTFDDLVIGSFIDAYKNLTYKHVMGFKYALYHCKDATYILKTDDDVFVNTPDLLKYIITEVSPFGAEKLLMCNLWRNAHVERSHRSRYRISMSEYPYNTYPIYCSGWFILYSPDVVFDLYSLAQNSEYFWVDDAFITGILAEKSKIPHFNIRNIVISKKRMDEVWNGVCDNSREKFLLGRPNIDDVTIRKLWACTFLNDEYVHA